MHKTVPSHTSYSVTNTEELPVIGKNDASVWPEYSRFHDSFAALLSYENNRKNRHIQGSPPSMLESGQTL